jgi:hypothetical protein
MRICNRYAACWGALALAQSHSPLRLERTIPLPDVKGRVTAHNIMLGVIETQKKLFKLDELDAALQTCLQDFIYVWKRNLSPCS